MTEHEMEIFHGSLERCLGSEAFVDRFYTILHARAPEAAAKFAGTDMKVQHRKLSASLYMTMLLDERSPEGRVHFERMAQLHSRDALDIKPRLYDDWVESLVEAAREFDEHFDQETERAWRNLLAPVVEYMKSRYDRPASPTEEDLDPSA